MNAKQDEIARLLRAGLDAYGEEDADAAVRAWNSVLALDPGNLDARDYSDSVHAGEDEAKDEASAPFDAGEQTLLEETVDRLRQGREVDALAVIQSAAASAELDLEMLAVFELVRARLMPIYRAGFREDAIPRAVGDAAQLDALCLPKGARALHAACDGRTPIGTLAAASGLDPFDTLHQLSVLVDTELVSI
jgi:hypothetical protein